MLRGALACAALCLVGVNAIVRSKLDQFPFEDEGAAADALMFTSNADAPSDDTGVPLGGGLDEGGVVDEAMLPASHGNLADAKGAPLGGNVEVVEYPVIPEPPAVPQVAIPAGGRGVVDESMLPASHGKLADALADVKGVPLGGNVEVVEYPVILEPPAVPQVASPAGMPADPAFPMDVSEIPVLPSTPVVTGGAWAGLPPMDAEGVFAAGLDEPEAPVGAVGAAQPMTPVDMGAFPGAGFGGAEVQSEGGAGIAAGAGVVGGQGRVELPGATAAKQALVAVVPNDSLICYQGPPQSMKDMLYRLQTEASDLKALYTDIRPVEQSCTELGFTKRIGQTCYGNTFATSYNMAEHFNNEAVAKETFKAAVKAMGIKHVPKIECVDCKGSC